jgi:hypothetical protein
MRLALVSWLTAATLEMAAAKTVKVAMNLMVSVVGGTRKDCEADKKLKDNRL